MKLSIAALKRMLPVGMHFTAEFYGIVNRAVALKSGLITRRCVTKQTSDMVSVYLDGPRTGLSIWLNWRGVSAKQEEDGSITLFQKVTDHQTEPFLKISNISNITVLESGLPEGHV